MIRAIDDLFASAAFLGLVVIGGVTLVSYLLAGGLGDSLQ